MSGPLLTASVLAQLRAALRAGAAAVECSLDLQWSTSTVGLREAAWVWNGQQFPYPQACKERTVYAWDGQAFAPVARYTTSLVKLIPTPWGPPTFEIDGIKMLPSEHISPYADAESKVRLIRPQAKVILDTCGGLGYFAAWCLKARARQVLSYEINPSVVWLRELNPWSPRPSAALRLTLGDIAEQIRALPGRSVDAVLHDPPRFGIAGALYAQDFYDQLARVLKPGGRLFHYTGTPNQLSSGRDLPNEVAQRLRRAGFSVQRALDGVLAVRASRP